jgi:signal transduction histidine kinase
MIEVRSLEKKFNRAVGKPSGLSRLFSRQKYTRVAAVSGLDLDIAEGEFFSLLGPNGAGKTTTARILCTLLLPDGGSCKVAGYDVARDQRAVRRNIGVSIQSFDTFSESEEGVIGWGGYMFGDLSASEIERRTVSNGYNTAMFAPLRAGDATGGVLCVVTSATDAYTRKHLRVLETIASQISGAVHASELYDKAVLWTEEREQRIVLEAQKQELERVSQIKTQIITTVSHELKTPLTSMAAFIDILSRNRLGNLVKQQLDQLEVLRRNGSHLHLLINDLLDHSRVESGTFELLEMNFDANIMLRALGESFEPLVRHANQTIEVNIPDGEVIVTAGQNRISQTISNMLSNATKYAGDGAVIRLSTSATDSVFSVFVEDDGIGMDIDAVENAFDLYFRGENPTTRAVSGLGLGLNISKTIIEMHQGQIFLSSAPGNGTRIGFEIPRVVRILSSAADQISPPIISTF